MEIMIGRQHDKQSSRQSTSMFSSKASRRPASATATIGAATSLFLVFAIELCLLPTASGAPLACNTTVYCQHNVHELSECQTMVKSNGNDTNERYCSNPFASGCLSTLDPDRWSSKKRMCNSEDTSDTIASGVCRTPKQNEFTDYMEVRLFSSNWESVHMENWVLQLVLSELMGVPTSIELGYPDVSMNFYHPLRAYDGGGNRDAYALELATEYGDCTRVPFNAGPSNDTHPMEGYLPCAHVVTEMWSLDAAWDLAQSKIIEAPQALGVLGQEGWYIPLFTAERDPSLLSYLGLQGPQNRRKVAETFLRPTTWGDYCQLISPNECSTPDEVATRPPKGEWEAARYFWEGSFSGHFAPTDDNDCNRFPDNCTGHLSDYPCGWTSNAVQQAFHLDIPVISNGPDKLGSDVDGIGGYYYDSLVEIWHAANYTKANVLMYWWTPDTLVDKFAGTDAEFLKVTLPTPTQDCIENRVSNADRCHATQDVRRGNPVGSCDDPTNPLQKVASVGLRSEVYHPSIPEALRSPAYDAVKKFSLTSMQLSEIFKYRVRYQDPRQAVCTWFRDNLDWAEELVPPGYPRNVQKAQVTSSSLFVSSLVVGIFAILLIVGIAIVVYELRSRQVMKYAQVEFLFLLVLGLFLIATGAIVVAVPSSDATCVASIWLLNLGYTVELVPLLVKISAINRLVQAATGCRRAVLRRSDLFRAVAVISLFVVIFLVLWTALDPPRAETSFTISRDMESEKDNNNNNDDDDDDVLLLQTTEYCKSKSLVWAYLSVGWNIILLVSASVLAFQSRKIRLRDFNESLTLGLIVYAQTVFVVLQLILQTSLLESADPSVVKYWRSILFSIDAVLTSSIYFFPKFKQARSINPKSSSTYLQFLKSSVLDQLTTNGTPTVGVSGAIGVSGDVTQKGCLPADGSDGEAAETSSDGGSTVSPSSTPSTTLSLSQACPTCGRMDHQNRNGLQLRHRQGVVTTNIPAAEGVSQEIMVDPKSTSSQSTAAVRNTTGRGDTSNIDSLASGFSLAERSAASSIDATSSTDVIYKA